MSRRPSSQTAADESPLLKAVDSLCSMTQTSVDHSSYIKQAFLLGLWHESFPEYMLEAIERTYLWHYQALEPEDSAIYDDPYVNLQKFQFISNTGDSWHQCYRDLRKLGWKRLKVHREGGRLQYLLHNHRLSMPEGYQDVHLILDISISTCKQVLVKTEMKEVPVYKTVCEDLVELDDDKEDADRARAIYPPDEPVSLVVIPDIEKVAATVFNSDYEAESEPRCEHGQLSGCCNQSNCPHFMGHDDPEPSDPPRNINEDSIPF